MPRHRYQTIESIFCIYSKFHILNRHSKPTGLPHNAGPGHKYHKTAHHACTTKVCLLRVVLVSCGHSLLLKKGRSLDNKPWVQCCSSCALMCTYYHSPMSDDDTMDTRQIIDQFKFEMLLYIFHKYISKSLHLIIG